MAMANSFIEAKVHSLDLSRKNLNEHGRLGALTYESAILSKDVMSFNLGNNNKDKAQAEIYYSNSLLKIDNGLISAQFDMTGNGFLDTLNVLKLENADSAITPTYFNLSGGHFEYDQDGVVLHANNFFLFCTANDPEYDMASGDGIIKGCMTELNVAPKSYDAPVEYVFKKDLGDNSILTMSGNIGKLNLQGSQYLELTSPITVMDYNQYDVEAKSATLKCEKDSDQHELDSEKMMGRCENTVELNVPKILVTNNTDKTKFYFDIKTLNVRNEILNFDSEVFQFIDMYKSVTVKDMIINCQKEYQSDLLDIPSVVKECIKSGEMTISKLKTFEEGKPAKFDRRGRKKKAAQISDRYSNIELDEYRPLKDISLDKSDLSDIKISIKNGTAKIKAHAYKNILIKKNFDIDMTAKVSFSEETSEIILDVKDVVVPFGFIKVKWIWLIEKIIQKAMVGSVVSFKDGKFYIAI